MGKNIKYGDITFDTLLYGEDSVTTSARILEAAKSAP